MTTKTDGQERRDFEAWFKETDHFLSELDFCLMPDGRYEDDDVEVAWEAYQAGRAALQSQDREDAMRWRYWRRWWANSEDETEQLPTMVTAVWRENPDYELDEAFDHAIRIEGEGK